jgi:hypothetical protein
MYPPFARGFGRHGPWHYVNGGVAPMVAGELAHGAFEHGFEAYGVDILDRVAALGRQYDTVPRAWRGRLPRDPERRFQTLDLRAHANMSFSSPARTGVLPWSNEEGNDLHAMPTGRQVFQSIPFDVIDPAENGGAACVAVGASQSHAGTLELPVGEKAGALYFLHTLSGASSIAGDLSIEYADGSAHRMYVRKGEHIQGWWMPRQELDESCFDPTMLVAWRGENMKCPDVGVMVWGLNNPHPDREIERVVLRPALDGAVWIVLGATLSDQPVWLPPSGLSSGIPAPWSVGAVIWAMFEGLAGVYDAEPNFTAARICPRWAASDTNDVTVTAKYEEGGGYVRYRYTRADDRLELQIACSGDTCQLEVLLPENAVPAELMVNGAMESFVVRQIESSCYLCTTLQGVACHAVAVHLSNAEHSPKRSEHGH